MGNDIVDLAFAAATLGAAILAQSARCRRLLGRSGSPTASDWVATAVCFGLALLFAWHVLDGLRDASSRGLLHTNSARLFDLVAVRSRYGGQQLHHRWALVLGDAAMAVLAASVGIALLRCRYGRPTSTDEPGQGGPA